MRPPKSRCGVQNGSDPEPAHQRSADLNRDARNCKASSTPKSVYISGNNRSPAASVTVAKVGGILRHVSTLQKKADSLQVSRTPTKECVVRPRLVPGIGGDLKKNNHIHQAASSSSPDQKMVLCGICMISKPFSKFFSIKDCKHSYCFKCLGSYIESKINMNVTMIGCPEPACKDGKLEPLTCKSMITKKVFDHWCDALCESTVGKKFYCPFKDCSAPLIDERGQDVLEESECPHCHRLFCVHCRVPWHTGLDCRKFQEMAKLGREEQHDTMLMKLAKESRWQRCPICKFYVERISGCMFIKCRCGFSFCYGCASEMTVDHFCTKCKR